MIQEEAIGWKCVIPHNTWERRRTNKRLRFEPDINGHYRCPTCNREFRTRKGVGRHHDFECSSPRYFQCLYCDKRSRQKTNIFQHIKRKHPKQPYKWEVFQKK